MEFLHSVAIIESLFFILFIIFWVFIKYEILEPIDNISSYASGTKVEMGKFFISELDSLKTNVVDTLSKLDATNANLKELVAEETRKYQDANIFLQKLFNNMHDSVLIHDIDGNVIEANDTALKMFGASSQEEIKRFKIVDFSTANNPIAQLPRVWSEVLDGYKQTFEWEALSIDKKVFFVEVFLTKVELNSKDYILANISDITKNKKRNMLIESIINLQDNIVFLASNKEILITNTSFLRYFIFEDTEAANKHFHCIKGLFLDVPLECKEPLCKFGRKMLKEQNKLICELQNGQKEIFLISTNEVFVDEEQYIVSLTNITDMELEKEALEIKSSIDHLTSLKNRGSFDKILEFEINKSRQTKEELSLIMFDIDKFKDINDTFGHQLGDDTLKLLAQIVTAHTRKKDTVARYGGEEFAIIAPSIAIDSAMGLAEKIRRMIDSTKVEGLPHFTCSFGVATLGEDETISELIKRTDDALYAAKEAGRNKVVKG
jgi:diguanylate cyclase (GGDEF)-like protein/PAS domain S-box-containing protein